MQPDEHKPGNAPGEQPAADGERPEAPETPERESEAGLAREVGDLDDPDAEDEGALPGRVGGGLAGG